jgi:hypothetical protein
MKAHCIRTLTGAIPSFLLQALSKGREDLVVSSRQALNNHGLYKLSLEGVNKFSTFKACGPSLPQGSSLSKSWQGFGGGGCQEHAVRVSRTPGSTPTCPSV